MKEELVKIEKRCYASCVDDIARLSNEVVKAKEAVEFERMRHAELERKLTEDASYNRFIEGQL